MSNSSWQAVFSCFFLSCFVKYEVKQWPVVSPTLAEGRGRSAVSQIPKLIPIFSAFFTHPLPHSFLVWPVFSFHTVLSLSLWTTRENHTKNPPAAHAKPVPSWPSWICICTEPACRIIIESTFPLLLEQFKGDVEVGLSIPHFHVYWLNCML